MPYPPIGTCSTHSGGGLSPGCWTGGVNLSGTQTLAGGIYIIDGGQLKINANATVTGSNITFVLLNGATVDFVVTT